MAKFESQLYPFSPPPPPPPLKTGMAMAVPAVPVKPALQCLTEAEVLSEHPPSLLELYMRNTMPCIWCMRLISGAHVLIKKCTCCRCVLIDPGMNTATILEITLQDTVVGFVLDASARLIDTRIRSKLYSKIEVIIAICT